MSEHEKQEPVNTGWLSLSAGDFSARRLKQMPVLDAGGTGRLTRPASKASIDVIFKC